MSDFLPKDLLIDVFTGLPIKTLGRCACVCKLWYSLITNPNFITTQVNRSSANSDNNLTLIRTGNGKSMLYTVINSNFENAYGELEGPLKSCRDLNLRIIGSCHGLLCLSEDLHSYKEKLFLWNLSIQKRMDLPPLRVTSRSHGRHMHSIGFGFDSVTDDYKVVRIVYIADMGFGNPPEVDIFSLSTGT
ncbi:F-box protein CPR1-like [Cornus florida]|uniref:F-box protein CPR1-like n=1 Tax=Cornus florida TaxID=4283 RepID=UPI00289A941F|nr:F-box protein CPR1-like [Cornus florida]